MPSIGALSVFAFTEGDLQPPAAGVTKVNQHGADGNSYVIGPKHQPTSRLVSLSISNTRASQDALKKAAAALVGTTVTIIRDVSGNAVPNCFVEGYRILSANAAAGLPGGGLFATYIEWEVVVPVSWV